MDANNIEEDGCAVCGRLVPKTKLSNLRHVARLLDVLVVPGVMRKERKSLKDASSHDTEPVLDRTCSCICDTCRADIRKTSHTGRRTCARYLDRQCTQTIE